MKNLLLILFVAAMAPFGFGQRDSLILDNNLFSSSNYPLLYFASGYLKCDSSYKVNNIEAMPIFHNSEKSLIKLLTSQIQYPFEALTNGLRGKVILKISLMKDSGNKYLVRNVSLSSDSVTVISNDVVKQVEKILDNKPFFNRIDSSEPDNFEFFLPLCFMIEVDQGKCEWMTSYFEGGYLVYKYYLCPSETYDN